MEIKQDAENLNNILIRDNKVIFDLLSEKGKAIYFPSTGIVSQGNEAKNCKLNASIGIARDNNKKTLGLNSMMKDIKLDTDHSLSYAPNSGLGEIRSLWKEQMLKKNPSLKSRTSLPIVVNALTHGLFCAAYMFLDQGEKIIMPSPYWENYDLIFTNNFLVNLDTFELFDNNRINIAGLKEKLSGSGKKIVFFNFPNNPTGYTPTNMEALQIASVLKESAEKGNKIVAIMDDAYFGLVYEQEVFKESLFSLLSDLHENIVAVKVDGISKEDYAWGLRVGFVTYACKGITEDTCKALEQKTTGIIRSSISSVSHLSQSIAVDCFSSKGYIEEKKKNYELLKSRYDFVKKKLSDERYKDYFYPLPYNSGYFMCLKLDDKIDPEKLRKILIQRYGTGVIVSDGLVRIAYSGVSEHDIDTVFDNIFKACVELKK